MPWGDVDEPQEGPQAGRGLDISLLSMPVRVEVSLTGAPWEFRARLLEAGGDYCLPTLVSPCAPAMRRGATAGFHGGTPGGGDPSFPPPSTGGVPPPARFTFPLTPGAPRGSRAGLGARRNLT